MRDPSRWGRGAAALLWLAQLGVARAEDVVVQPGGAGVVVAAAHVPAARLSTAEQIRLLRQRVKYVFVLFQENRSFDSYFGTFPGADGLFSQPPERTPGYHQPILNRDGTTGTIAPFRLGPDQHAADLDDVDHGSVRMAGKMDVQKGVAAMDRFALVEEGKYNPKGGPPSIEAKQYGELTMAYVDCDTIPLLWRYASRFVLFDHFFQRTIGPSTPNAIAMIAGQTGETQWLKHPSSASNMPVNMTLHIGEPVVADPDPDGGPRNPRDHGPVALNQTYASLPLTFAGSAIRTIVASDGEASDDLADVQADIRAIDSHAGAPVNWGWYQEGYDAEPGDTGHSSYIGHHNGPQYFGYITENPAMAAHLHGLNDFYADIAAKRLPAGGVFYVRGGFKDIGGRKPAASDASIQRKFGGDDDHPGYADSQISETMVARSINAIAASPYWGQSAILITYDESEGDYDHVPPRITEYGPTGAPLSNGPRIPLIVISPYARAHAISHEEGNHSSVIKLIDALFGLPKLADLPDELQARMAGQRSQHQDNLGPSDDRTPGVGDLVSAFDPARLNGTAPPLGADYAAIPLAEANAIPPYGNAGCKAIGMVPTDQAMGIHNPIPGDFNPRPSSDPTPD